MLSRFSHVLPGDEAQENACNEFRMLKIENIAVTYKVANDSTVVHKVEAIDFWHKVFNMKQRDGEGKYPNLSKLIQHVLVLPFGTASVERDFSIVNIVKSKLRNKISLITLDALLRVRENIPDNFAEFVPTQKMYNMFNSNIYVQELKEIRENNHDLESIDFFSHE
jgi:hypothetical protein